MLLTFSFLFFYYYINLFLFFFIWFFLICVKEYFSLLTRWNNHKIVRNMFYPKKARALSLIYRRRKRWVPHKLIYNKIETKANFPRCVLKPRLDSSYCKYWWLFLQVCSYVCVFLLLFINSRLFYLQERCHIDINEVKSSIKKYIINI